MICNKAVAQLGVEATLDGVVGVEIAFAGAGGAEVVGDGL